MLFDWCAISIRFQGNRFVSLADYCAMGHSEVSMKEGDIVEFLKRGIGGWVYVKILSKQRDHH